MAKPRCDLANCKIPAHMAGDCGFCNKHFCGKHRLLEDHKCEGLEDVRVPDDKWWLVGLSDVLTDFIGDECLVLT